MNKPKSHVEQLAEYLKRNIRKGYTLESLKFSLLSQGYTRLSIDNAIVLVNKKLAQEAPLMKEKPQISHAIITDEGKIDIVPQRSFFSFLKHLFRKR